MKALQCLLKEAGLYNGQLGGSFTPQLLTAVQAWQTRTGFPVQQVWSRKNWATLFAAGAQPVLKFGSAGPDVRRVQRALNALYPEARAGHDRHVRRAHAQRRQGLAGGRRHRGLGRDEPRLVGRP